MSKNETTKITFRADKKLKKRAERVFEQMGMTTSGALNIFMSQCVREQRLPFQPGATAEEVNENSFESLLDEADEILGNVQKKRKFADFEEFELEDK